MAKRILITGSRSWTDRVLIENVLRTAFEADPDATLVSGNARGADKIAEQIWEKWGGFVERHPADWDTHGKKAGFLRNREMAKSGADVCIAFIRDDSRGANMMANLAEKEGIFTIRFKENTP